jgi:hypothetical protein
MLYLRWKIVYFSPSLDLQPGFPRRVLLSKDDGGARVKKYKQGSGYKDTAFTR